MPRPCVLGKGAGITLPIRWACRVATLLRHPVPALYHVFLLPMGNQGVRRFHFGIGWLKAVVPRSPTPALAKERKDGAPLARVASAQIKNKGSATRRRSRSGRGPLKGLSCVGGVATHPCTNRKGGAPICAEWIERSKTGHALDFRRVIDWTGHGEGLPTIALTERRARSRGESRWGCRRPSRRFPGRHRKPRQTGWFREPGTRSRFP